MLIALSGLLAMKFQTQTLTQRVVVDVQHSEDRGVAGQGNRFVDVRQDHGEHLEIGDGPLVGPWQSAGPELQTT